MEELQFKDVEIIFDKENPQRSGVPIKISAKANKKSEQLEYKFIVGKSGIWSTIQEFSDNQECIWSPNSEGEYIVMVQARDKLGKKPLDYFAKEDYLIDDSRIENTTDDLTKDSDEFKQAVNNIDERVTLLGAGELTNDEKIFLNSNEVELEENSRKDFSFDNELVKKEVALDKIYEKDIEKDEKLICFQEQEERLQQLESGLSELLQILPDTEELLRLLEEKADQIQRLTDENQQWQELAQKLNNENRLLQKQNSELLNLNSN